MRLAAAVLCVVVPAMSAAEYRWEVPERIRYVEAPELLEANGYNVRLAAAISKLPAAELAQYYMTEFQKAGLFVPGATKQVSPTSYPMLTGLDTENLVSFTVIFQPNKDNTTTVVLGMTDLSKPPDRSLPDDFAPLFPGAKQPMRTNSEGMRSISFQTSATVDEVKAYYREVLVAAGYAEKSAGSFVNGEVRIKVYLQTTAEGTQVVLNQLNADPLDDLGGPEASER